MKLRSIAMALRSMLARGLVACCLAGASSPGYSAEFDMTEVRRLAKEPVQAILKGTPFAEVTDADYQKKVKDDTHPVIVLFYADRDEKSRNLATLARYIAADFGDKISFVAYRASPGAQVDKATLQRLQKAYGVKQIPATFFYDNDKGKMELERTNYTVPTLAEYRTPSALFFKIYYNTLHDYIIKHILD
jgi:thiol-disulfide isomerase/thioredoxin